MIQTSAPVIDRLEIASGVHVLSLRCAEIAHHCAPGQFVNVRCGEGSLPLLRRPFSISRVDGDAFELMFTVVGHGTRMMASRRVGESLDVLGPLGISFRLDDDFETAILVGGGVGIAPFPFLTDTLLRRKKKVSTFIGARSGEQLTDRFLATPHLATDDGSRGFRGTVVDLLRTMWSERPERQAKIFGCGPTRMLQSLAGFAQSAGIPCELSLEGEMACGMGLCQGCAVELSSGRKKYALVCVDGPAFKSEDVLLR